MQGKRIHHRKVQHGITQEFQALVVVSRKAAVGQRTAQQSSICERMLQAVLQRQKTIDHAIWIARRT